jgi:hypothetical protein
MCGLEKQATFATTIYFLMTKGNFMKMTTFLLLLILFLQTNTAFGMLTRSQATHLRQEREYLVAQLDDNRHFLEENRDCGNWQTEQRLLEEQGGILERIEQIDTMLQFLRN